MLTIIEVSQEEEEANPHGIGKADRAAERTVQRRARIDHLETSFEEDLGADSLDLVELMMALEEEFDVGEIDEETARKLKTVGDVVDLIGAQD